MVNIIKNVETRKNKLLNEPTFKTIEEVKNQSDKQIELINKKIKDLKIQIQDLNDLKAENNKLIKKAIHQEILIKNIAEKSNLNYKKASKKQLIKAEQDLFF